MRKSIAILLFSILPLLLWAQQVSERDLSCGTRVKVTANAKPGYHFTEWSDGVTDNPRWIDIDGAKNIVAYFAPDCKRPEIPVEALYEWMLIINKAKLDSMGFTPAESEVRWYRVIKEQDAIGSSNRDDELVHVGYYLTVQLAGSDAGRYYAEAEVNVSDTFMLCSDTLRSDIWSFDGTHAIQNLNGGDISYRSAEGYVYLSGLPIGELYEIRLLDMSGRAVARYEAKEQTFMFTAPPAGCYIIQITTRGGTVGLRYIQY